MCYLNLFLFGGKGLWSIVYTSNKKNAIFTQKLRVKYLY